MSNNPIGFAISAIKLEQFAAFEDHYKPKVDTHLNTFVQFSIEPSLNQIGVLIGFEFHQGKKILIKLEVRCFFKIEEPSWKSFFQENKIIIPKEFLAHLAMITTGTSRGILFTKTESTQFSKFIIPTINVSAMIQQNAEFEKIE